MDIIKHILLQLPLNTKLVITRSLVHNFCEIGIVRDDFAVWATADEDLSNEKFSHLVTDLILDFNRKAPLEKRL